MTKISKKRKVALSKIENGKKYDLQEAAKLVKEITYTKFDASVDLDVRLGVDPRKANQMVRGITTLPHGTGKQVRVLVLCTPDKEQEAKNLQMQYFGAEGQLYQKRTELIQPIQEKVYTAMKEVAQAKNYAFILDLASGTSILYANDRNDVSDEVLDQLGNVMQTVRREDRRKASQGNVGGAGASNSSKGNSSKTIKPKK